MERPKEAVLMISEEDFNFIRDGLVNYYRNHTLSRVRVYDILEDIKENFYEGDSK